MVGPASGKTGLGGDEHSGIGMQRLPDQHFGDVRPVGIGGIDEVNADFRQPPQRAYRVRPIDRLAPNAGSGNAHGAKAEAIILVLPPTSNVPAFPASSFAIGLTLSQVC